MADRDVTQLLERLEAFEDRLAVRLEALNATLTVWDTSAFLSVRGELHPQSGTQLPEDLTLVVAAYDSSSQIVGTTGYYVHASRFFGFEVFNITTEVHVKALTRVRVFPKKAR